MRSGHTGRRTLLVAAVGLVAAACGGGPMLQDGDDARLERQGDRLRGAAEAYRAAHGGRYPASLAAAGVPPERLWTRFGAWEYERVAGDSAFALRVGDYGRNGFVLFWSADPPPGHWSWDQ